MNNALVIVDENSENKPKFLSMPFKIFHHLLFPCASLRIFQPQRVPQTFCPLLPVFADPLLLTSNTLLCLCKTTQIKPPVS